MRMAHSRLERWVRWLWVAAAVAAGVAVALAGGRGLGRGGSRLGRLASFGLDYLWSRGGRGGSSVRHGGLGAPLRAGTDAVKP